VTYAQNIQDVTLDRSYEYDQAGRLAISHSGAEARAHAYSGQWGTQDGPYSQGYDYDVWGNVTHKYGWGGEVQGGSPASSTDINYAYTGNRRNGFSYDAAGNLTSDIGQNFTYDVTGQQTASTYTNLQNSYDGDGLRVKRTEDGLPQTYYLRSSVLGGQVVAEIIPNGASWQWNRGYVYLGSQLLAVQDSGVYWMHEDPVTKSKRVTNSSGAIISTIELDPWGADTNRSSNVAFQPKKFTSYERDANGSDEAMFRRYNRWHSRFDQPDPYDGSYDLSNPQSFNRYAYVNGDPVNFVDPSGLMAIICQFYASDGELVGGECFGGDRWGGFEPKGGGGLGGGNQQIAAEPGRLSLCVIDLLAKFFDRDLLEAIRIDQDSSIVPPTMGGITIGDKINFKKGEYDERTIAGIVMLAHEITHSEQYRAVGSAVFLQTYTASSAMVLATPLGLVVSAVAATQGKNLPHDLNVYEQAANAKARQVRDYLVELGYGEELHCGSRL